MPKCRMLRYLYTKKKKKNWMETATVNVRQIKRRCEMVFNIKKKKLRRNPVSHQPLYIIVHNIHNIVYANSMGTLWHIHIVGSFRYRHCYTLPKTNIKTTTTTTQNKIVYTMLSFGIFFFSF